MEDDGVSSEEEDIFAGVPTPASETESEYQTSEEEDKQLGRNSKFKRRQKSGEDDVEKSDLEDDNLLAAETRSSPAEQRLLQAQNLLKRKESPVKLNDEQSKRSKATWSLHAKYRDLLNNDIADIVARRSLNDSSQMEDSQVGAVFWSSLEKEGFFNALSRLGQDNIREIAQHIVTKSEPEVSEYLSLLRSIFVTKRARGLIYELPDLPAAAEISQECCEELETTADAFAALQEEHEIKAEREKWGESWLLTPETSYWLNKKRVKRGGEKAIDGVLPAINLFDLDMWLELSSQVFMNAGPEENEDNWHNLVEDETMVPTIRATAFEDFHNLAGWVTKKLVSTTLFCAMSRLRSNKSTKTKAAEVNEHDVRAAIDVLKMRHDSAEFWSKCARRFQLRVVDDEQLNENSTEQDYDDLLPMSYTNLDLALSTTQCRRRSRSISRSMSHVQPALSPIPSVSEASSSDLDHLHPSTTPPPSSIASNDTAHLGAREKRALALTEHTTSLDNYTSFLDHQASLAEELRLWSILKKEPPSFVLQQITDLQNQEEVVRPAKKEEERDERYEWREWVGYRGIWEDQGMGPEEAEFAENRVLRRVYKRNEEKSTGGMQHGLSNEFIVDEDEEDNADNEEGEDAQSIGECD